MDRLARPKDDLFDNSTMTFGEHLEELRQCLVKAIIWLGVGLAFGLYFADRVILFVQVPLQAAIQKFSADRDLYRLGYGDRLDDPELQPLRSFLMANQLTWQVIYDIPEELQSLDASSILVPKKKTEAEPKNATDAKPGEKSQGADDKTIDVESPTIDPVDVAALLAALPDPESLKPRLQLVENRIGVSSLKIEEPFMIWIKAGLIVGAVFASPMIFYHLWTFVAAGLHYHERKYVYLYMPMSVVLFISGVVLAFFLVLQYVLSFLLAFNSSMDVAIEPRLTHYVNFVLLLPLGFGIAFQLPLVMLFLQRIGLLETESYIASWKVAILVIFVLSMLLTPADVTSMIALAIPLVFLYILGILMCKFIPRGRGLGSGAYDPA